MLVGGLKFEPWLSLSEWISRKTLLGSKCTCKALIFLHLYYRSFWLVSNLHQPILHLLCVRI